MEPKIAEKGPFVLKLEAGSYHWCSCGHSKKQPYCDGSHREKAEGFVPLKFELAESKNVALCGCKHSKNKPFCDGAHNSL